MPTTFLAIGCALCIGSQCVEREAAGGMPQAFSHVRVEVGGCFFIDFRNRD